MKQQTIAIRPCRVDDPRDFVEIDRLERECAQGTLLRFHFAPDDPRNPRPRAFKFPNRIVTVAETQDGRIVGTVSGVVRTVRFGDNRFEKVGWIFSLRVGLDQRRTGVASQMLQDMEQRLRQEFEVTFIFDSVALENIPAVRLFEKLGYHYMWKARFYGINISHTKKMLDKRPSSTNAINVNKLDCKQSKAFLSKHFGKSFLFPQDYETVFDSNVYVACQGEHLVAANVWSEGDKMGIVAIPIYLRLLYYIMIFLSFLFPNFFEKPLPLSRPWMMRWAYPILIDCNSRDRHVSRDLFNAAINHAVGDLSRDGTDVLMMPCERHISGLHESNYYLVRKHPHVSPLMRGTSGVIQIGRGLVPEEQVSADLQSTAAKQSFWFLNCEL